MKSARDQDHLAPNVSTSPAGGETGPAAVAGPATRLFEHRSNFYDVETAIFYGKMARPLSFERPFLSVNEIGSADGSRDLAANAASIH